jgi:hypothetical protein
LNIGYKSVHAELDSFTACNCATGWLSAMNIAGFSSIANIATYYGSLVLPVIFFFFIEILGNPELYYN